jgi:hypothetical protein
MSYIRLKIEINEINNLSQCFRDAEQERAKRKTMLQRSVASLRHAKCLSRDTKGRQAAAHQRV